MKRAYMDKVHTYGRVWSVAAVLMLLSVPVAISFHLNAWPSVTEVFKALGPIALIYYPTCIVELLTYVPMLGAGGTYLSFVTGNITNLKLPCGLNAMESAGVRANTEEGEVISTIAIGVSAIVTTVIIALSVVVFRPILPIITKDGSLFKPAFQQVVPALFGALGAGYFIKHWKISVLPIAAIILTLAIAGNLAIGFIIPIGIVVSMLGAQGVYMAEKRRPVK
jgi:hypothetical protein